MWMKLEEKAKLQGPHPSHFGLDQAHRRLAEKSTDVTFYKSTSVPKILLVVTRTHPQPSAVKNANSGEQGTGGCSLCDSNQRNEVMVRVPALMPTRAKPNLRALL